MLDPEHYLKGWLVYGFCAVIVMACCCFFLFKIRNITLRWCLAMLAFAILVTPWYSSPDLTYLAPAWVIAGTEMVFDGLGAFWRAGTALLSACAAAVVAVLCVRFTVVLGARARA